MFLILKRIRIIRILKFTVLDDISDPQFNKVKVPQPHFILSDIARDRDICLIIALERHSEHFLNPYNRRV